MTDIGTMVITPVMGMVNATMEILPFVIAAIIILIIGWIVGRILGRIGALFFEKTGISESLGKTRVGMTILHSGCSLSDAVDWLIRIVVYLFAVMAAADTLQIESLQTLIAGLLAFIPNIIAFVLILVIGLILVDYFMDMVGVMGETAGINLLLPVTMFLRVFLYFIVIMLALTQLKIQLDIIYAFIVPVAWGVGLGIGAAIAILVGFGLKDRSNELMDCLLEKMNYK
jgi:amino acid transporter